MLVRAPITMKMATYSRNTEHTEGFIHRTSYRVFLGVLCAPSAFFVLRCFIFFFQQRVSTGATGVRPPRPVTGSRRPAR